MIKWRISSSKGDLSFVKLTSRSFIISNAQLLNNSLFQFQFFIKPYYSGDEEKKMSFARLHIILDFVSSRENRRGSLRGVCFCTKNSKNKIILHNVDQIKHNIEIDPHQQRERYELLLQSQFS